MSSVNFSECLRFLCIACRYCPGFAGELPLPVAATGDMSGCSNSFTPFALTTASQVSSPFLLNTVRDQSFKKQKYFWCLPFLFKIFVIKILTDGFGDTSFLIKILRHIFKSLLIMQQSWREEAGFGMSSCFFFFPRR